MSDPVARLADLLDDDRDEVQIAAAGALGRRGEAAGDAVGALVASSDSRVRSALANGMADGRPFVAMKMVKGQRLAKKLAERESVAADRRALL